MTVSGRRAGAGLPRRAAGGGLRTHITDAHKTFDSGDHGSDLRNLLFEQF